MEMESRPLSQNLIDMETSSPVSNLRPSSASSGSAVYRSHSMQATGMSTGMHRRIDNSDITDHRALHRQNSVDARFESLQSFSTDSSGSSALITKMRSMKEKLRRHMVQTVQTGDWPPPAAVLFNDRSIQSSSAGSTNSFVNNTNARERLKKKRQRYVEGSATAGLSVDSSGSFGSRVSPNKRSCPGGSYRGGIVCSQTDLKAIMATKTDDKIAHAANVDDINVQPENDRPLSAAPSISANRSISQKAVLSKRHSSPATFKDDQPSIQKQVSLDKKRQHQEFKKNSSYKVGRVGKYEDMPLGSRTAKSLSRNSSIDSNNSVSKVSHFEDTISAYTTLPPGRYKNTLVSQEVHTEPKEVVYDEHGQTWEIYGAEPDPEVLGKAIQSHLDHLMNQQKFPVAEQIHKRQPSQRSSCSNRSLPCDDSQSKATSSNPQVEQHTTEKEPESVSNVKRFWQRLLCLSIAHRNYSPSHETQHQRRVSPPSILLD